jgi:hypothetical protein
MEQISVPILYHDPWSRKPRLTAVGASCDEHATPLYPQKFALTSPTSGCYSADIVRLRTKGYGSCFYIMTTVTYVRFEVSTVVAMKNAIL